MISKETIILAVDLLVLFFFFYMIIKNMQTMRIKGATKALTWILIIWGVSSFYGMEMTTTVFGTMLGYVLLLIVILFPEEFRKMLDKYGRRKSIFYSKDKLIGKEERESVAEAMIEFSRMRTGFLMVIAKGSGLEDEIDSGDILGEIKITKDMLKSLWSEDSAFNRGAMIVRDNVIVSANSSLPIARKDDLIRAGAGNRHLAALGITYAEDCVALVVSESTGKITIASKNGKGLDYHFALETREHNIRGGLDATILSRRIEEALTGKEGKKEKGTPTTREEREKEIKERAEAKRQDKEAKRKEYEERKKLRQEGKEVPKRDKKKKEEKEDKPKSRGFGGYGGS